MSRILVIQRFRLQNSIIQQSKIISQTPWTDGLKIQENDRNFTDIHTLSYDFVPCCSFRIDCLDWCSFNIEDNIFPTMQIFSFFYLFFIHWQSQFSNRFKFAVGMNVDVVVVAVGSFNEEVFFLIRWKRNMKHFIYYKYSRYDHLLSTFKYAPQNALRNPTTNRSKSQQGILK